jgi:hypothetical protein
MPDPNSITLVKRLVKGSPLTATEMDANLTNLAAGITGDWTKFLVAHGVDGVVNTAEGTVNGSALTKGTVGYDKLSTVFYEADSNANANEITIDIDELTAAPATGSVFFIKVSTANTDSVTLNVVTGSVTTQGPIKKGGATLTNLTNGDLLNNQVIAVAYAGSSEFHLLSNLSVSDPGIVKIATVESDSSSHTSAAPSETQIGSYSLASNSYSKIIIKATARVIAGYGITAGVQFWNGSTAIAPSYEMPQMQVPSGKAYSDSTATASTDIKYAPWQTFVAQFDGGQGSTSTIYFYKTGTSADYKAELDFLEVYGVI